METRSKRAENYPNAMKTDRVSEKNNKNLQKRKLNKKQIECIMLEASKVLG